MLLRLNVRFRMEISETAEYARLAAARDGRAPWKAWGPYVSERAWGTVREDYSPNGKAWEYFPHDHARSRAYRWSEDATTHDERPNENLAEAASTHGR